MGQHLGNLVSNKLTEHVFEALIDHSFDGIGILDRNGVIKYTSDTIKKILGFEPETMIGKKCFEYIDTQDLHAAKEIIKTVLKSESEFVNTELRLKHANGEYQYIVK